MVTGNIGMLSAVSFFFSKNEELLQLVKQNDYLGIDYGRVLISTNLVY